MTEHYTNSSVSGNDWSNAMTAAKEINDCMNAGWSAYVWWYIRRSYGFIDESGTITKLGYVMSQFARYIRPGSSRIACTANPMDGVYVTAYKDDSKLVVVAINQNLFDVVQPFSWSGITVTSFNHYVTTSSANLVTDSLTSSGSDIRITLLAQSVTTLVSQ
jgi:glucuronoarabinoxylan endo-1,4-beta-xylanase